MKKIEIRDCREQIQTLGRVLETENGGLFCNWTCSGIRFQFEGCCLAVRIMAVPSKEQELNKFNDQYEERLTWPWFAVFIDDEETPYQYFEANRADKVYSIFQSEEFGEHTVTIRKITENAKGKICITEFLTDGKIKDVDKGEKAEGSHKGKGRLKLEFIGDSITCGFGNMVNDDKRMFYSEDENGWMAYPAVAARRLGADFHVISCSGIAITEGIGKFDFPLPPMKYYYPYCDRMAEEIDGSIDHPALWDFRKWVPDIIVLNLGTNDATVIDLNGDTKEGIEKFEADYYEFLKMLRHYNGREPWIICSLGSMDYYLYDNIQRTVSKFCEENNDTRIHCFKYGRIRVNDGLGACSHPYVTTQIRMGEELAEYMLELV